MTCLLTSLISHRGNLQADLWRDRQGWRQPVSGVHWGVSSSWAVRPHPFLLSWAPHLYIRSFHWCGLELRSLLCCSWVSTQFNKLTSVQFQMSVDGSASPNVPGKIANTESGTACLQASWRKQALTGLRWSSWAPPWPGAWWDRWVRHGGYHLYHAWLSPARRPGVPLFALPCHLLLLY